MDHFQSARYQHCQINQHGFPVFGNLHSDDRGFKYEAPDQDIKGQQRKQQYKIPAAGLIFAGYDVNQTIQYEYIFEFHSQISQEKIRHT